MQLLAENIRRHQRDAFFRHAEAALAIGVMIFTDYAAVLDLCTSIDNAAVQAAVATNVYVGEQDGIGNRRIRLDLDA